jgi:hypothetical protein
MASIAKVELLGSLTHTHKGRVFKKGQPQVVVDTEEIACYQSLEGFSVTILEKAKEKSPVANRPIETVSEDDDEVEEQPANVAPAPKRRYTEPELKAMNKAQLSELALGYDLAVDELSKKADIIADILLSQG